MPGTSYYACADVGDDNLLTESVSLFLTPLTFYYCDPDILI